MKKGLSVIYLFAAAIIWGFAFAAQKAASAVGAFTIGAVRSAFAAVFLVFAVMISDRLTKSERRLFSVKQRWLSVGINRFELFGGALSGAFLFLASYLQQLGIEKTDASTAAFITALYVLIVPIYALLFGKRSPLNVWCGSLVAIIGFYFLSVSETLSLSLADFLVLLCAFVFAAQIMTIDGFSKKSDPIRFSLCQFTVCSLLSLVFALIFEAPLDFAAVGENIGELLYLGIGSSGIAYTCQIIGQKRAHPAAASIILSLESVFGAIAGVMLLGESMTAREIFGAVLVVLAVILAEVDFSFLAKKKLDSEIK